MATSSFDNGFNWEAGRQQQRHAEALADRTAQKNKLGALYLDSINTPLPKVINDPNDPAYESSKQAYQDALGKRQALMQSYVGLNDPVQHASFAQHLHGLIFGNPEPAQPAFGQPAPAGSTPRTAAVPASSNELGDPLAAQPVGSIPVIPDTSDMHPFAPHPALGPIMDGIKTLGSHLQAAAHPVLPAPPQRDMSLLASTYTSPEELKRQDEDRSVQGRIAVVQAKPKIGFPQFLESYANDKGLDSSSLTPAQLQDAHEQYGKSTRAPRWTTVIVADPDSPTKFSKATIDQESGETVSLAPGAVPPRGFIPTKRVTSSVDQYGNVTHTTSELTPEVPGINTAPASAAPASVTSLASATPAAPLSLGDVNRAAIAAKGNKGKPISRQVPVSSNAPVMPGAPAALDANGLIPQGAGNPQVREAANQLLDGKDIDKLPTKAREAAAAMARQYGWEQGKFTPREQSQIRVAATMLQNAMDNPALKMLDDSSFMSGLKTNAISQTGKHGFLGSIATRLAANTASPAEAEYARMYKQLVGTISGLGPTLRSKGMTEATVNRLMGELPDPLTTQSSFDAKERLGRLLNEINVAMQKGKFDGSATAPVSKNAPKLPGSTPKEIVVSAEDMRR